MRNASERAAELCVALGEGAVGIDGEVGRVPTVLGVASEAIGVLGDALGEVGRMLGGGGRATLDEAIGVKEGLGGAAGGGACWLGRDNGVEARFGGGGGIPEGRDGTTLVPPFGRGGCDTGRGGCATGLGSTAGGSLPIAARLSLSLAVPCSSPMEASAPDSLSIAQIALALWGGRPRRGARINAS